MFAPTFFGDLKRSFPNLFDRLCRKIVTPDFTLKAVQNHLSRAALKVRRDRVVIVGTADTRLLVVLENIHLTHVWYV